MRPAAFTGKPAASEQRRLQIDAIAMSAKNHPHTRYGGALRHIAAQELMRW